MLEFGNHLTLHQTHYTVIKAEQGPFTCYLFTNIFTGLPIDRMQYVLAEHKGFVYVAGGCKGIEDKIEFGDIWRFDMKKKSWTKIQLFLPQPQGSLLALSLKVYFLKYKL